MEVFLDRNLVPHCDIKIFAFSSACLSLKFLFNLPCIIGFGSEIIHQSFYDEQVNKRIQHELELNYLLQQIWGDRPLNLRLVMQSIVFFKTSSIILKDYGNKQKN
ncbi:hypothetical protein [Chroococcidiopsis cubana]|uniref:hypothetical protein n=1 Tax=Chroococcidiopsis cubana TaxID=171392 RepID=UPI002ACE010B|nr:hypothetical protein [Chroococcidiopsis cubana]